MVGLPFFLSLQRLSAQIHLGPVYNSGGQYFFSLTGGLEFKPAEFPALEMKYSRGCLIRYRGLPER